MAAWLAPMVRPDLYTKVAVWSQKGALSASLNYYRAVPSNRRSVKKALRRLEIPVLLIWGEQDPVFVPEVTERFEEWVPQHQVVRIREASHFVQSDAPEAVSRLLVDFLRA